MTVAEFVVPGGADCAVRSRTGGSLPLGISVPEDLGVTYRGCDAGKEAVVAVVVSGEMTDLEARLRKDALMFPTTAADEVEILTGASLDGHAATELRMPVDNRDGRGVRLLRYAVHDGKTYIGGAYGWGTDPAAAADELVSSIEFVDDE